MLAMFMGIFNREEGQPIAALYMPTRGDPDAGTPQGQPRPRIATLNQDSSDEQVFRVTVLTVMHFCFVNAGVRGLDNATFPGWDIEPRAAHWVRETYTQREIRTRMVNNVNRR